LASKKRTIRLVRRATIVIGAKATLALLAIVFAATVTVTSNNYQTEIGTSVNVKNQLLATDKGFSSNLLLVGATSCSNPITFSALPGIANTQLPVSHLVYDIQVNTTISTPANAKYNATLVLASNTYGPVCIQVPAVVVAGETIDCKFDVGTALPTPPYAFQITIK